MYLLQMQIYSNHSGNPKLKPKSNKVTVLHQSSAATPHPVTNLNNLNMISDVSCEELK